MRLRRVHTGRRGNPMGIIGLAIIAATAFGVWSASTVAQSPRPADHTRRSSADAGKVAHQTVAETLHIELALVATPVGGFGHLPAHHCPTHLRPRRHVIRCLRLRPLRGLRRRSPCNHTEGQQHCSHRGSSCARGVMPLRSVLHVVHWRAHATQRADSGTASAQAQRDYFQGCVATRSQKLS